MKCMVGMLQMLWRQVPLGPSRENRITIRCINIYTATEEEPVGWNK